MAYLITELSWIKTACSVSVLALLLAWETGTPFFAYFAWAAGERTRHGLKNLALGVLNASLTGLLFAALWWSTAAWAERQHFGLLRWAGLPAWARKQRDRRYFRVWLLQCRQHEQSRHAAQRPARGAHPVLKGGSTSEVRQKVRHSAGPFVVYDRLAKNAPRRRVRLLPDSRRVRRRPRRLCGSRSLPSLPRGQLRITIQHFARPCPCALFPFAARRLGFRCGSSGHYVCHQSRSRILSRRRTDVVSIAQRLRNYPGPARRERRRLSHFRSRGALPEMLRLPFHRPAVVREGRGDHPPRTRRALRSLPWSRCRARERSHPQPASHSRSIDRCGHEPLLRSVSPRSE